MHKFSPDESAPGLLHVYLSHAFPERPLAVPGKIGSNLPFLAPCTSEACDAYCNGRHYSKDAGVAVSAAGTKYVRTTATAKRPCTMVPSQAAGEKRQAAGQASVKSVCDAPAIGGCDHKHGAKHSTQLLRYRYMTRELL